MHEVQNPAKHLLSADEERAAQDVRELLRGTDAHLLGIVGPSEVTTTSEPIRRSPEDFAAAQDSQEHLAAASPWINNPDHH